MFEVYNEEAHGDILILGEMTYDLSTEDDISVFSCLELIEGCYMIGYFSFLFFVSREAHGLLKGAWYGLHKFNEFFRLYLSFALNEG